ncbi:hypothetical protein E2C01_052660 [Portunus trituberculatus]|uniref:Uncharacterized protein n=1 Tax=Portunus trituberculatus TaxID=210409 RepID=A0A5B7GMD6_PORTR|nr:hypothetical protein [Portunus trituberculatus]
MVASAGSVASVATLRVTTRGLLRELWIASYLPAAPKHCYGGWKRGQFGSTGHSFAVFPGPCLCKVPLFRCANSPSVGCSGWPHLSSGDGHWHSEDLHHEVMAAQHLPVSDRQLCDVTGHYMMMLCCPVTSKIVVGSTKKEIPVFMANMEEPCLLEVNFLV